MKKTLILFTLTLSILAVAYIWANEQDKRIITLDFDAYQDAGKKVVLEAEYADGSNMPFAEAEEILKKGERCQIILSEDDGTDRSDYSMGGHRKWGFFGQ